MELEDEFIFEKRSRWNKKRIILTNCYQWQQKRRQCIVNDNNCKLFYGVAGHAGLFGTAKGVLSFVENLFLTLTTDAGVIVISEELRNKFLKKENLKGWFYGFDTPSSVFSSSGKYFSNVSYGHLGFTGTSFWIDLQKECGVVLLTNRVLFENSLKEIKKLRPVIHDAVMNYIFKMQKKNQHNYL